MSNSAPHPWKPRSGWRRWVRGVGCLALGALLMLMWLENSLIFFPHAAPRGTWAPPTARGEEVRFASADGTELTGWFLPHPQPRAVVLFACGNGGNMSYWREVFATLHARCGVTVMAFDYRGYGRSRGSPNEKGVLADARAARSWLARRTGIAENQVVLMGRSIGGAVMIDLAQDGARGLIVESTFTTLPDVAARVYPWLPVRWVMRTRFDSLSKIKNYAGPLLVSHGTADSLVPLAMGKQLFDAAGSTAKTFYNVPDGGHNDPQPDDYYDVLADFIAKLP